jgi:Ni/Co efflux regulator RcnB
MRACAGARVSRWDAGATVKSSGGHDMKKSILLSAILSTAIAAGIALAPASASADEMKKKDTMSSMKKKDSMKDKKMMEKKSMEKKSMKKKDKM